MKNKEKCIIEETKQIKDVYYQILEYFEGKRFKFDIAFDLAGTKYQHKIWEIIQTIPYGQTVSYKEIAIKEGNKNGARAVGNALNKNPLLIVIPYHRVIRSDGKKRWVLSRRKD